MASLLESRPETLSTSRVWNVSYRARIGYLKRTLGTRVRERNAQRFLRVRSRHTQPSRVAHTLIERDTLGLPTHRERERERGSHVKSLARPVSVSRVFSHRTPALRRVGAGASDAPRRRRYALRHRAAPRRTPTLSHGARASPPRLRARVKRRPTREREREREREISLQYGNISCAGQARAPSSKTPSLARTISRPFRSWKPSPCASTAAHHTRAASRRGVVSGIRPLSLSLSLSPRDALARAQVSSRRDHRRATRPSRVAWSRPASSNNNNNGPLSLLRSPTRQVLPRSRVSKISDTVRVHSRSPSTHTHTRTSRTTRARHPCRLRAGNHLEFPARAGNCDSGAAPPPTISPGSPYLRLLGHFSPPCSMYTILTWPLDPPGGRVGGVFST